MGKSSWEIFSVFYVGNLQGLGASASGPWISTFPTQYLLRSHEATIHIKTYNHVCYNFIARHIYIYIYYILHIYIYTHTIGLRRPLPSRIAIIATASVHKHAQPRRCGGRFAGAAERLWGFWEMLVFQNGCFKTETPLKMNDFGVAFWETSKILQSPNGTYEDIMNTHCTLTCRCRKSFPNSGWIGSWPEGNMCFSGHGMMEQLNGGCCFPPSTRKNMENGSLALQSAMT